MPQLLPGPLCLAGSGAAESFIISAVILVSFSNGRVQIFFHLTGMHLLKRVPSFRRLHLHRITHFDVPLKMAASEIKADQT